MAVLAAATAPVQARPALEIVPFKANKQAVEQVRAAWTERILTTHKPGTWAPLKFSPTDEDLAKLGLPSSKVLLSRRYPSPTMVTKDGRFERVTLPAAGGKSDRETKSTGSGKGGGGSGGGSGDGPSAGPAVASFAGAGWFGIRPGAWLLLLNGGSVGWCSLAHVYGSPGSYDVSTAGHCGKTGDVATVIAAFGNRNGVLNPILLDFGKFASSRDGGLGADWGLIDIPTQWQHLVSPTMAAWGGPRGMYTKTGSLASVTFPNRGLVPTASVTPDPLLAQTVVHYGHGTAIGTGGTPRAAEAISWGTSHFMFSGAIAPGDSGSGANTLLGDTAGANMEAAGILTHIWVDPLMRSGIGIMGGTRATQVTGTLANGQLAPYPVPLSGAP